MTNGEFTEKIKELAGNVSDLSVGLAIESFKDARRYPDSYSEERILADMQSNINKIAMGAIEIDSREGVEGQLNHSENGITRGYSNGILAYRDVVSFGLVCG